MFGNNFMMSKASFVVAAVLSLFVIVTLKAGFVEGRPISYHDGVNLNLVSNSAIDILEDPAVRNLRSYLRIRTAQPNPEAGYRQAVIWLQVMASEIGLEWRLVDLGPDNLFAVIMTWTGSYPSLPSVLFNSHMDVADVEPEFWTYPPFDAVKDENGKIYARGSSDMKSATIATLEAIRRLKQSGFQPLRTIHVTILPDEENGSFHGMKAFVASKQFKDLNVGIDIDEGGVNPEPDTLRIYYGEKSPWQFKITALGKEGHGSTFPEYTSGDRLQLAISRILEFRRTQYLKLQNPGVRRNQITTINLVRIGGGIGANVIPNKVWAEFDMRVRPSDTSFSELDEMLENIVEEAGTLGSPNSSQVSIEFVLKSVETAETVANSSNVWWDVVQNACKELKLKCPAAYASPTSDAKFVRSVGIPVFGIGPVLNTHFNAHRNNEAINEQDFLDAIDRYFVFIRHLSMYPSN